MNLIDKKLVNSHQNLGKYKENNAKTFHKIIFMLFLIQGLSCSTLNLSSNTEIPTAKEEPTVGQIDTQILKETNTQNIIETPKITKTSKPTYTPTCILIVYIVKEGDTLYGIAAQFGVSVKDIMDKNPDIDWMNLFVGQEIIIPICDGDHQYTVTPN